MPRPPPPTHWKLRFLYVGTSDIARDVKFYCDVLGAKLVWCFHSFGADVAAVSLGEGPPLLLADHMAAPSCELIFEVKDLDATTAALKGRGWKGEGEPFEIPNGPCVVFLDPSGNRIALFEDIRPGAMESSYADDGNERAVR